jgi:hypothetical protein
MRKIIALLGLALVLTAQTQEKPAEKAAESSQKQVSPSAASSSSSSTNGSAGTVSPNSTGHNGGGVVTVIGDGRYRVTHVYDGVKSWSIPMDEELAKMLLRLDCDAKLDFGELYKRAGVPGKESWVKVPITCAQLQKKK